MCAEFSSWPSFFEYAFDSDQDLARECAAAMPRSLAIANIMREFRQAENPREVVDRYAARIAETLRERGVLRDDDEEDDIRRAVILAIRDLSVPARAPDRK